MLQSAEMNGQFHGGKIAHISCGAAYAAEDREEGPNKDRHRQQFMDPAGTPAPGGR
jgi:hypothetical protein